ADLMPIVVPEEFSRAGNRNHQGDHKPIGDDVRFSYGTAGFRDHADRLPFIVFRMGYLAALRARTVGKAIGVMITASHNPEEDNGVKIVDPKGEMLAGEWEKYATELVNATDDELPTAIRALEVQLNASSKCPHGVAVVCGRDTRASGKWLTKAVESGAALFKVPFMDKGELTTPQLHYVVRVTNEPEWGAEGETGYYENFSNYFDWLLEMMPMRAGYDNKLHLDCANGIGAKKMRLLYDRLPKNALAIEFLNENGRLNHECGADYVKIARKAPANFESVPAYERCAVFDGDADRLVYFYKKDGGEIELLDGDKIALLIAKYYKDHLSELGLDNLTFAIVQTAYANGNSSRYMTEQLGITPVFVPTGVKHLHHEALKYDVGVYFEANGHGTVTFSPKLYKELENSNSDTARRLWLMSRVINEIVGDAMADLLAVELILRHYNWSVREWAAMYEDAPSKQLKIPVDDRSLFKTTRDETRLVEPSNLQKTIDDVVGKRNKARAFVRPSGTENIVRVYAECESQTEADDLAREIETALKALTV
ncbi:hypothetical protein PFISCL1PPCAC_14175, partial [Pristionchus fissidentatus]